ncbi:YciI family protein [Actinomycetospora endophytica]|uniref:YciI family protein n=1 Tax=Actinomycetospora endophytica TaxID=2291215 RepID=A0ABS8PJS7_9PSEU|nr:YciI family protein [Actinomycetospora endophytica]MCD2197765.1 YciI family protein [Actinomycetospora endophytica]
MARYMLVLKYDEAVAMATPPDPAIFEEMGRFNTAMVDAGVLLAGEGLAPSSQGAVVTFPDSGGDGTTVSDGPFTEARELIGGFWILKVDSLDEAVSWARKAPFRAGERIEVRRVTEAEDFEGIAPESVLEQEKELRERAEQQHGG